VEDMINVSISNNFKMGVQGLHCEYSFKYGVLSRLVCLDESFYDVAVAMTALLLPGWR
jgi:hypothetical protein